MCAPANCAALFIRLSVPPGDCAVGTRLSPKHHTPSSSALLLRLFQSSCYRCRACGSGRLPAVKALIKAGKTPLEIRDGLGGTPLYVAASTDQQQVCLYLLSKGADVEVSYQILATLSCCSLHMAVPCLVQGAQDLELQVSAGQFIITTSVLMLVAGLKLDLTAGFAVGP